MKLNVPCCALARLCATATATVVPEPQKRHLLVTIVGFLKYLLTQAKAKGEAIVIEELDISGVKVLVFQN